MPYNDQNESAGIGDIQSAIAAGAALSEPRAVPETVNGLYTVVPDGYKLESLEDFLPRPQRVRQEVSLHDAQSFIGYLREFGDHELSWIFFDQDKETFQAILDYHAANGAPGWCDHTATFTARRSVEFQTWLNQNRKQMGQVDFARFLEDNLPDVVEPAGATLLEVALTFEAKKDVEFASGVRLSNGQVQFTYNEVVRGTAQKGTIEIPEKFVLGIPIHLGGPGYRIDVRLRWRLHEGKAMFAYELVRPHRYVEDALKEIRERIGQETGLDVLAGVAK
jgi:uncharacterized protein YfdQ (DUF2303 family)